jgi:WD40 repeat protein
MAVVRLATLVCALFAVPLGLAAGVQPTSRTDFLRDPLPAGAVARLGTLRLKHLVAPATTTFKRGGFSASESIFPVTKVLFSPDGKVMASTAASPAASTTSTGIHLWDATTGKELPGPQRKSAPVFVTAAFSTDGALLAVSGVDIQDGRLNWQITIWEVANAKLLHTLSVPGKELTQDLAFADDNKTIVTAGVGIVRWWDVASGKEKRSWKPFGDEQQPVRGGKAIKTFFTCVISPGAKYLAVQTGYHFIIDDPDKDFAALFPEDPVAMGFDLATNSPCWSTPIKPVGVPRQCHFAFSADEKWVAQTVGRDKVELRETATGKLIDVASLDSQPIGRLAMNALALSSDGSTMAIAGVDSLVMLWEKSERTTFREFTARIAQPSTAFNTSVRCLAFSPDNKTLLAGVDTDLQLYDVATLKEVFPWEGHRGGVDYVAFSPDGKQLRTCSAVTQFSPQEVISWDVAKWKQLAVTSTQKPKWPNIGTLSAEHTVYAGGDGDDRFCIYDHATGNKLGRLAVPGKQTAAARSFFSPSGNCYVLQGQNDKGEQVFRLFAIPSCKLLCELPLFALGGGPLGPLVFAPNERLVAVGGASNMVHVYDAETGAMRHSLGKEPEGDPRAVPPNLGNVAFSPDSKLLASLTLLDNVIRVWDLETGKERLRLPSTDQGRGRLQFAWSPDGRMLAVADRKIQLIEVVTGRIRHELDGHKASVRAIAFSPDGRLLASGSADTTVLIWDVWGKSSK